MAITWLKERFDYLESIGITKEDVAQSFGVSLSAIDKWERGHNRMVFFMDAPRRQKFAEILQWTEFELCQAAGFPVMVYAEIENLDEDRKELLETIADLEDWQVKTITVIIKDMIKAFDKDGLRINKE